MANPLYDAPSSDWSAIKIDIRMRPHKVDGESSAEHVEINREANDPHKGKRPRMPVNVWEFPKVLFSAIILTITVDAIWCFLGRIPDLHRVAPLDRFLHRPRKQNQPETSPQSHEGNEYLIEPTFDLRLHQLILPTANS